MFIKTISKAEGCVLQGAPRDANQLVLIGYFGSSFMPLNEVDRIIDEKIEDFTNFRNKTFNARRTKNGKGARVRHLSPHHQKTRNTKTVVPMKVADSDDPKRLDSQFLLLKIDLTAFTGIEDIELALKSDSQRGEKPIRQRHHAPGAEKYTVHPFPQRSFMTDKSPSNDENG
jgi:hypothetical protein